MICGGPMSSLMRTMRSGRGMTDGRMMRASKLRSTVSGARDRHRPASRASACPPSHHGTPPRPTASRTGRLARPMRAAMTMTTSSGSGT